MAIRDNSKSSDKQQVFRLFMDSLIALFVAEMLVMLALYAFIEPLHLPPLIEGLIDSFSLSILFFPILYLSFFRPLTLEIDKRVVSEKMRNVSECQYAAVIRTAMDGFWLMDNQGRILEVNDSYCRLIGYSRQELLKMSVGDVEVSETPEDTARHINRVIENGSDLFETRHRKKDGSIVDIEVSVNYLDVDGGRFFVFLRDISERKRYENEIISANRELVKLARLKTEFITTVSHELRTPIGIMREGVSQVVEGLHGEISAEQRQCLGKSLRHMERLTRIVNSILEIANLEAGRIGLRMESVDIAALAWEMIRIFEPSAQNKNVEIRSRFSGRGEPMSSPEKIVLNGDKNKLGQVFTGLIDNAVKFTETGHIEVQVQETADTVECVVADTGRGMTKEASAEVFDKFQQFGREYGPGQKGVGLGLAIAKGIIELHKGKIWIESEPGKGTKVSFTLPKGTP